MMFSQVPIASSDPIFGMNENFIKDPRENKINLGIGSYKTEQLQPLVLESVYEAEKALLDRRIHKEYLRIDGDPEYVKASKELIFGQDQPLIYAAQTIGGTGALSIGGQFLFNFISKNIFIPNPTWDNHRRLFSQLGFTVNTYPYYDANHHCFDFQGMCLAIEKMPKASTILLHACCHNPTGFDPTNDQWQELSQRIADRELVPFFDLAYQGFGRGIREDVRSIRIFLESKQSFLVANSFSKNFGLYAERVGSLNVVTQDRLQVESVGSQIKVLIRGKYSNPPCHGARIVNHILRDAHLRSLWEKELEGMRQRILTMRTQLVKGLDSVFPGQFNYISQQLGMFSYTGLSEAHVERLTKEFAIYLTKDGRINIAGLNPANLMNVIKAIQKVVQPVGSMHS